MLCLLIAFPWCSACFLWGMVKTWLGWMARESPRVRTLLTKYVAWELLWHCGGTLWGFRCQGPILRPICQNSVNHFVSGWQTLSPMDDAPDQLRRWCTVTGRLSFRGAEAQPHGELNSNYYVKSRWVNIPILKFIISFWCAVP